MIGNEVSITSKCDLNVVYGLNSEEHYINIGKSILEDMPIKLSIDKFFASHIGIFGNTGSGKSNTLHKLYLELFKTSYMNVITKKSKFFVIDFNGEYSLDNMFGVDEENRLIFDINTRHGMDKKLPVCLLYTSDAADDCCRV